MREIPIDLTVSKIIYVPNRPKSPKTDFGTYLKNYLQFIPYFLDYQRSFKLNINRKTAFTEAFKS